MFEQKSNQTNSYLFHSPDWLILILGGWDRRNCHSSQDQVQIPSFSLSVVVVAVGAGGDGDEDMPLMHHHLPLFLHKGEEILRHTCVPITFRAKKGFMFFYVLLRSKKI